MKTKKCSGCKIVKDTALFYKCASRKDGLYCYCKECTNGRHKVYVTNNKEKINEYDRNYYKTNRTIKLSRKKTYYNKNKEKCLLSSKQSRIKNAEEYRKRGRERHKENKEKMNALSKIRYQENKEEYKQRARERKYLIRSISDGTVTREFLACLIAVQEYKCNYCKTDLTETKKHLDHIVPVSKGGLHTINNVQWTCEKCNLSKNDKLESEWLLFREE